MTIDERNDQPIVSLWCKFCGWKGPSNEAGWTDEDGGEWNCPKCGGAESIRVASTTLEASDEDHAKALAFCGEQADNERVAHFAEAIANARLVDEWFAEAQARADRRKTSELVAKLLTICQDCVDVHTCEPDLVRDNREDK